MCATVISREVCVCQFKWINYILEPDAQLRKYLAPALLDKMASPTSRSKYRKETSKQNSREDNQWSPSKPRSIALKRGGSSYQRNQNKPLSRQLMPGLVFSLLFSSLFPPKNCPANSRLGITLGGWEVLSRPIAAHSAFPFLSLVARAPSDFSFVDCTTLKSASVPAPDSQRPPRCS